MAVNKKLNKKAPFGTVINHGNSEVVYSQGFGYYNASGDLVLEKEVPADAPEAAVETKPAKKEKAKVDAVTRAASILGDLGSSPAKDIQQEAARENMAAEHAESKSE